MRGKILEKQIVDVNEVYNLAELIERTSKETLQYETSKIQHLQLGAGEMITPQNVDQGGLDEATEVNTVWEQEGDTKRKRPWIRYPSVQFEQRVL